MTMEETYFGEKSKSSLWGHVKVGMIVSHLDGDIKEAF